MSTNDPFPPSDFDAWAESYDQTTRAASIFPFDGYERVLQTVIDRAEATANMSILDLGTGTANLAVMFAARGCELWCTDFSAAMLDKARLKLPHAHFVLHDLRDAWPTELDRRFDRIVSGYVFHHFELEKKVSLCRALVNERLNQKGKLVIADLSFPNKVTMNTFAKSIGKLWEEEFYWMAEESLAALKATGLHVTYEQVSACAGVYVIYR